MLYFIKSYDYCKVGYTKDSKAFFERMYFIKSYDYCKVGYTKDSKAFFERMRKYLTHNPSFQILDIRKGKLEDEKMIHTLIPKELYHYGEWCVWDKEIA